MAPLIKKSFWSKLTGLEESDLKKTGQEIKIKEIKRKKEPPKENKIETEQTDEQPWLPQISEGKLSVDVCLDDKKIVIISAIAGVRPDNLEIIVDKDILTLKGERQGSSNVEKKNYLHQECFWGKFSRTILLPCEVKAKEAKANLKNGILTIALPIKEGQDGTVKILPKTNISKGK